MKTPEKVPCAKNLRDWFAGQALAGYAASKDYSHLSLEILARLCYDQADWMLIEREHPAPRKGK